MARTHEIERSANSAAAALEPQRAGTGSYPAASGWIIGIFFFSFLSRLGIVIQRVPLYCGLVQDGRFGMPSLTPAGQQPSALITQQQQQQQLPGTPNSVALSQEWYND